MTQEDQLIQVRAAWYQAFIAGDTGTLDRIEADSFFVVNESGIQGKRAQLQGIAHAVQAGDWFPEGSRTEDQHLDVLPHGELALVRGRGRTVSGDAEAPSIFFTELWQRQGDAWRVASLHYTRCKAALT
jgi:hypothetical protein